MHVRIQRLSIAAFLVTGCAESPRDEVPETGGVGTTTGTADATGGGTTGGSSSSSTGDGTAGSTGAASSTSDGTTSGGTTGQSGGSTGGGNPDGKPNGEPCSYDGECMSGNCYLVPMAGFCAECNEDADCPNGGCQADPVAGEAFCTDGGLGTMCQSDAACTGDLVCGELFDAKGFVEASYCGHCASDADCPAGRICAPHYEEGGVGGYNTCVDPGTVPNDQGCPVDGNGQGNDAACASGICSVADAFGLGIYVGACGECSSNADCGGGTCVPASATLMGVKGSKCQ